MSSEPWQQFRSSVQLLVSCPTLNMPLINHALGENGSSSTVPLSLADAA
jgi:hypothetical protein